MNAFTWTSFTAFIVFGIDETMMKIEVLSGTAMLIWSGAVKIVVVLHYGSMTGVGAIYTRSDTL